MLVLRWLAAIVVLPGTVLIVVPSLILCLSNGVGSVLKPSACFFWVGMLLGAIGAVLALWTMFLFFRYGKGTAAPWNPPQQLVVRGPYCYTRNPMITAALIILLAESLQSLLIFLWFTLFLLLNVIYIPAVEEKRLEKKFGRDYLSYRSRVPRWIPR